jgi:acetyl-CoA acetyltransferase
MSFGKKVAILSSSRTPFVKSQTQYTGISNQELLGTALTDLINKTHIQGKLLGDLIAGAVMNHPFDWNLARDKPLGSIDTQKVNVKGGSLALGHPFAATGGRIVGSAAKILAEKGKGRILLSVCTAGGMGVAAIIER